MFGLECENVTFDWHLLDPKTAHHVKIRPSNAIDNIHSFHLWIYENQPVYIRLSLHVQFLVVIKCLPYSFFFQILISIFFISCVMHMNSLQLLPSPLPSSAPIIFVVHFRINMLVLSLMWRHFRRAILISCQCWKTFRIYASRFGICLNIFPVEEC